MSKQNPNTMKKLTLFFAIILTIITLSAQERIVGSGKTVVQERKLAAFTSVSHLSSTFNITIKQSNVSKVIVTADDNLIDYILTEVSNGTLTVSVKPEISYSEPHVTITVYTPHLNEVVMKGTGNVTVLSVKEDHFTVTCKGTGSFKCDCLVAYKDLVLQSSGTGKIDVSYLCRKSLTIINRGTGSIKTKVLQDGTEQVNVQNAGTGTITMEGLSVSQLSLKNTGTGSVYPKGKAENLTLENDGTGHIKADRLTAQTAHIIHKGVGSIRAHVTGTTYLTKTSKLGTVKITGGGKIIEE